MARDFYADAERLFGFDENEADNLLEELEELGFDPDRHSLGPRSKFAEDIAELVIEMADEDSIPDELYELDYDWEYGDDDYLDAGVEVELSIEYTETT